MFWEYRWGDKGFYDDEMGLGPFDYVALGFIYVSAASSFFLSFFFPLLLLLFCRWLSALDLESGMHQSRLTQYWHLIFHTKLSLHKKYYYSVDDAVFQSVV